ncbi:M23 family metallopeptidase [Leucobacter chironomi]|uniref:M23 family metallopeptidase n=1 Tax=Leucobacter chironomi TaxID=491918 RepID=UPI000462D33A|nr:M23 family metallopeptidase [Leucobacter chironomi]
MSIRLVHPCPQGRPTDSFGWRAEIPGVVRAQLHSGQDWAAPEGTPVRAMHSGRVNRIWWDTFADGSPAGGNMIQLGAAQCSSRYAHLSGYAVSAGDEVQAGQIIGYVGSTGAATGDHLHGEVLIAGSFVDPMPYITSTPTPTQKETNDMATSTAGVTTHINGTRYDALVNPESGFAHVWQDGDGGHATAMARAFGVPGNFAELSESQWYKLHDDLAAVRKHA